MFDGLVRWAIFADADGIVREDVDHGNFHQRAEPDRTSPVVAENQEPRSEGSQLRQRESVENRAHRVFTDAKVQIAARSTVGLKITRARERQSRLGGRRKVSGATDHPGKVRRDGIEDFGRSVASGYSLAISWKNGNILRPVHRQLAFLNLIELRGKFGKLNPVLGELFLPQFARFAAPPSNPGLEVLVYPAGNQELGVGRPAVRLLHQLNLLFAERLAVRRARVLAMRRTIADMTINDYDRWSARRARGIPERVLNAIQIVGIPDTNDVPSIRQKSPGDVFGERDIGFAFDRDVIVVIDPAQIIELQVPGNRGCLARDSFHHAAIAAECVNAIAEQFKIWLVVTRGEPLFGNGHAHTRGNALSQRYSGCPAQRLPNCRKDLRSSSVTEGRPRISYSGSTAFTLARCRIVYNKVDACPAESTKRSRFIQMGSSGSNLRSLCHRQ